MSHSPNSPPLTPGLVWLMAIATGLAVAGNYYAQPLLPLIAQDLRLSIPTAGALVTMAQGSYALGLFMLVPLGDLLERRRLIVVMMLLTALGLVISALASQAIWLFIGTMVAGLCSVVAQVLVPLAASMATPATRGKVLGVVMSGLLLGILLARTAAGLVAELGSWRGIYWLGSAAMLGMAYLLARRLPRTHPHARLSYPRLLLSVLDLLRTEPLLQQRTILGVTAFACFSVLWTALAFLLAAPPYSFTPGTIGLFGLVGAAGATMTTIAGRLLDRGHARATTVLSLLGLALSWLPLAMGQQSIVALLGGILLLDMAVQAVHVCNQNLIYSLAPEVRNRLNAGYVSCNFVGMAAGSLLSAWAFARVGWLGVVLVGAAISLAGLIFCIVCRPVRQAAPAAAG